MLQLELNVRSGLLALLFEFHSTARIEIANIHNQFSQMTVPAKDVNNIHIKVDTSIGCVIEHPCPIGYV